MELSRSVPHIALIPSPGMGHLTPVLRLASSLLSNNCNVTLVTAKSTVSHAESEHISLFLSTHPHAKHLEFELIPHSSSSSEATDPFLIQYNAIGRSADVLCPLLSSSSPPLSAIFSDLLVARSAASISAELGIPFYIINITSARFFCFILYLPFVISDSDKFNSDSSEVEIPGLNPLPITSVPLPFLNPNHLLAASLIENAGVVPKAKGVLVNSFGWFEAETFDALNNGKVLSNLPPVLPIGPLEPYNELELDKHGSQYLHWLDKQLENSVVYVSFGSRTAMSKDQIRELGGGLDKSGCKFLWVVKTTIVDKEDKEELEGLLGLSFFERTKNTGIVVKGWVNQLKILAHPATGLFISHCGWNSVTEAAQKGVPVLAWPLHGDQRVNAEVLEMAGLGILDKNWGMGGRGLVKQETIAKKIVELIQDSKLRSRAGKVREEARKAIELSGSSCKALNEVIEKLCLGL